MNRVQKAIIPAFLVSSALIIMLTQMIAKPQLVVQAFSGEANPSAQTTPVMDSQAENSDAATPQLQEVQPEAQAASEDSCTIGTSFPDSVRQWCGIIEKYASQQNLDPNLIASVILQESGGKPDAYSKSGAVGLMQVMPRDGLAASFMCSGRLCFSSRPSMDELYDADFNISYGTRMLAGLLEKKGSMREALRSYGPMDVGYYYADLVIDIYNSYQ